jgi:N-acetylglucosaminyldiphosphoundecaprenol N-acetyl-beta-D-mannosaminyltransferase
MERRRGARKRVELLGGTMDLVTPDKVLRAAEAVIGQGRKAIVLNHNAHSLALFRRCAQMRALYAEATIVEIDSMPVIAWGRMLGLDVYPRHRCTYLDWREAFWPMARDRGWKVFYLGGEPGVAETAAENLRARWGELTIGVHHGYFDRRPGAAENDRVVETIEAFAPDVLFVGLGMPAQELWIAANHHRLTRGAIFSVGAAFDYEAGVQPAAPRWLGRVGAEWLFRFASQPRRLFWRYFIEPWSLLGPAVLDLRQAWALSRIAKAGAPGG